MSFLSANDEVHCNRTSGPTREDDLDPHRRTVRRGIVEVLLPAGASFGGKHMFDDASTAVREVLRRHGLTG
jgi:hypothetical protein